MFIFDFEYNLIRSKTLIEKFSLQTKKDIKKNNKIDESYFFLNFKCVTFFREI